MGSLGAEQEQVCTPKIVDAHAHYGTVSDTPFMSASFEKVLEVSRDAGIEASVFLGKVESAVDPDEPNRQRSNRNIDLILGISEQDRENILFRNAERFFGMEL